MKKYIMIPMALTLSACGGFDTKQEFLQDQQNMDKFVEISSKLERSPDCDKLGQLYEFSKIDSPTTDDLAQILPLLGLSSKDATNIDKLININFNKIDNYNCVDNTKEVLHDVVQYCQDTYYDEYDLETVLYFPFRLVSTVSVFTIIGAIPFTMHSCGIESAWHPIACKRKQDCKTYLSETVPNSKYYGDIDKNKLKQRLKTKITDTFLKIPEDAEYLLDEFKPNELIKANNAVIGTYDDSANYGCGGSCYNGHCYDFCDTDTKNVTQLNAIKTLYNLCIHENNYVPSGIIVSYYFTRQPECRCFAHETYKKVNYKNLVYIYEKEKIPLSKQNDFYQTFEKCKQKTDKQRIKSEQQRYGEADTSTNNNDAVVDFIVDTIDNGIWAIQQANKEINKERKKSGN